ncbi:MAG: response regulator, partial [Deltaproteobacteria bacterium]|nr:response regulator [Deltaproteobacteria bacterium]
MESKKHLESSGRLKILLIEDELSTQQIITKFLERLMCDVMIAGDGIEAIDNMMENDFDLILMDIRLPNLDGFELIRHFREQQVASKKRIPIVAMSGSGLPEDYNR